MFEITQPTVSLNDDLVQQAALGLQVSRGLVPVQLCRNLPRPGTSEGPAFKLHPETILRHLDGLCQVARISRMATGSRLVPAQCAQESANPNQMFVLLQSGVWMALQQG